MKNLFLFTIALFIYTAMAAQTPQGFKYQAVARDATGKVLASQSVSFRISILSGSESGSAVYSEVQKKTTNGFGLVDFAIGSGTNKTGSFEAINWSDNSYFVKVELDPAGGTAYQSMGTSQLMSVPYALHAKTVEVDKVDDADADATNEIQTISKTGSTVTLSKGGGSVSVDDADADATNEIQTISKSGNTVTLSNGGGSFTDAVDDADADATNEIQALGLSGTSLTLSKGGGTVTLPSSGGGDNWGAQTAATDATLTGNGTAATPLKIAQQSATNGQVLKWNGTTWIPGNEADTDPANEIQSLSISGNDLSLSKGGSTVTLPIPAGFSLPFTANSAFYTTPFSIVNTGTALYTIAGYSDYGYSIYGKTNDPNGAGVLGDGKGTNSSIGVQGLTGEGTYSGVPGNIGVAGRTNAHFGIVGTAISGTGGYFSSESGLALKTIGSLQLTSIGEGNGKILTSDANGNASWQTPAAGGGLTLPFLGAASSNNPVFQVTNNGSGYGIKGIATNVSSTGVIGESPNQGVLGHSTASSDAAYGVQGVSESTSGSGVTGYAASATGSTFGIRGINASSSGKGVYGYAISSSGITYGIYGETVSESGIGIYGTSPYIGVQAYGTGTFGYGAYCKSNYIGVEGLVDKASGYTYGVVGVSYSTDGTGVYGNANASSGTTYGIQGIVNSSSGSGVFGEGPGVGVKGYASNADGVGVSGSAPYVGVKGMATSSTGTTYGVFGDASSAYGYGVFGQSPYVGVYGYCSESGGWSGYFSGRVGISGHLGVGTAFPSYPLEVAGCANLNYNTTGVALRCNGAEAIWYNDTYFSWGFGGSYNFFGDKVFIGATATNPGSNLLVVNGTAAKPGGGSWATWSDIRLKDVHGNFEKGINEIIKLQPVTYSYKKENAKNLPSDKNYVGFVAQDVQTVFPEAVTEETDGFLSLDVNPINVAVINALKELKAENDKLKAENQELRNDIKLINERLSRLEK